jgi:hypothetical protein
MSLLVFAVLPLSLPAVLDAVDSVIHLVMVKLRVLVNLSPLVLLQTIVPTGPLLILFLDAAPLFLKTCAARHLMPLVTSKSVMFKLDNANKLVDVPNLREFVKSQAAKMDNVSFPNCLTNPPLEPVTRLFAIAVLGQTNVNGLRKLMMLSVLPQALPTNVSQPPVMLAEIALSTPFPILPRMLLVQPNVILVSAILQRDGLMTPLFALRTQLPVIPLAAT